MVSSLKNHLRQKGGQPQRGLGEYEPADAWPLWSKTPRRRRRDTSTNRDLAKVREAHQRTLAAAATLEERIERLSHSTTRGQQDASTHSWSCDCQRRRSQEQNWRHHRALQEDGPVHSPAHSPPQWGPGTLENKETELPFWEFDLGTPPEFGPEVNCFLQEPASKSREDSKSDSSLEAPAEEHERWVTWRGWALNTPSWWQELVKILEVEDFQELA